MFKRVIVSLGFMVGCSLAGNTSVGQTTDPLLFPKDSFKLETKIVKTSAGEKKVTFRSYLHIPYVAKPVDKEYQSLNVSVPVTVEGVAVDATNAPILFTNGIGGYMSASNTRSGFGMPRGGTPGTPPGGKMNGGPEGPNGFGGPGKPPEGMPPMPAGGFGPGPNGNSKVSRNADLALAAGYVVVSPGCRGRDNQAADGTFYGKAPAAIVDLKGAVRYIRHNKGVMPGNVDWIFSTGVSAGGALSALLGSSGNNPLYDSYLEEIGAAKEADNICGCACFCPITDLEHADGAYEWMYRESPARSGPVDQELSKKLKADFAKYQAGLNLQGKGGFGTITADNFDKYLLQYFLYPAANKFLKDLTDEKRKAYLEKNSWIIWSEIGAAFTFTDYVAHVGRMKSLPAFDDFNMKQGEPIEFGNKTTDARHFTNFSLQQTTGDPGAEIESDLKTKVDMMNAMFFIIHNNQGCANHWWLRQGTSDNHTSQTVIANLATSLENRNKDVNTKLYWDAGHGADEDAEDFISWIGNVTGFARVKNR